jgi:osmotically-inducible protein OsmY
MIYGLSYWDFYDTVITSQVQAGLLDEPSLKVNEIIVDTFKGVVQLSGPVSSRAAADTAIAVALGIGGVNSVKDDMRVK